MPYRPWKEEEVQLLRFLHGKRRKLVVPGRSSKSIRRKLIILGLEKPAFKITFHRKSPWTLEEIALLKRGSAVPHRSKGSIRSMAFRLGLIKHKKGNRKPWKKKEERLLLRLVKEKKSAKQIFEMNVLPYSRNSIQKKMCYMNLSSKRTKPICKLSPDESLMLRKFLLENYQGKTPEDLMNEWNLKPYFKISKSKVIYYLNALRIKISCYEVAKINNLRKKEQSIKSSPHRSLKDLEESIRIARVDFMRDRLSQGRDLWTGLFSEEAKEGA